MVIFDPRLIAHYEGATDPAHAIEQAAIKGIELGLYESSYVQAVCARELEYPTGLLTASAVGVAIPHATPTVATQHISLSVARFATPVTFQEMGNPDGEVAVQLVCLMSVSTHDYLGLLSALAGIFQGPKVMTDLLDATSEEIYEIFIREFERAELHTRLLAGA